MQGVCRGSYIFCVLCLVSAVWSHVEAAGLPDCSAEMDGTLEKNSLHITGNCTWGSAVAAAPKLSIVGARTSLGVHSSNPATPVVFAAASTQKLTVMKGTGLQLERLVLVGFDIVAPDAASGQPLLWPGGITAGSAEQLNLTDVRVVVRSQEVFNKYLEYFTSQNVLLWTDNTNFIHIQEWSDTRTQLRSVGVLLAAAGSESASPPDAPLIKNCLLLATNTTLVPTIIPHAAVATPLPLLVYLTSNVTLGLHPALGASGLLIKRPIVFVGLRSTITPINFEMVVNQLNVSGPYANTTFVGLALENLAPGDAITSAVASPFSIAITNNLWAVYYNRSAPNQVRWALYNVTMVLPDAEMSYVTYMFTLYSSPLQYLQEQTQFYSEVLNMTMLQFMPGPGNHAITVHNIYSLYHRWGNVVLTTQPVIARQLPTPSRPLVLTSAKKTSPLVQAVRTQDELRGFAGSTVVGDRDHILLFLTNVSLPVLAAGSNDSSTGQAVEVMSPLSWVGYNPGSRRDVAANAVGEPQLGEVRGKDGTVFLDCVYQQGAVVIPANLGKDALQLQQLVLSHLPQGRGAAVPGQFKALPSTLFTVNLWSFERPPGVRAMHLLGVMLLLPEPELDYFKALARAGNDFVVEMESGGTPLGGLDDAVTFENANQQGDDLHVEILTGPGFLATNVTLRSNPEAAAAMPGGYQWPDPSQLRMPAASAAHPRWVMAVVAVCVTLAVVLLALAGYIWWQRKRISIRDAEIGKLYAADGSNSFSKAPSRCSCPAPSSGNGSLGPRVIEFIGSKGSPNCTSSTCAMQSEHPGSEAADVQTALPACVCTDSKQSPHPAGKDAFPARLSGSPAAVGAQAGPMDPCLLQDRELVAAGNAQASKDVASQRDVPLSGSTTETSSSSSNLQDSVAAGMQRWRAAVSSTTMLLMERRMDAAAALAPTGTDSSGGTGKGANGRSIPSQQHGPQQQLAADTSQRDPHIAVGQQQGSGGNSLAQQQLQLLELLGQGSFGSVFLALWRGKRVAVKVMQLPASALLEPGEQLTTESPQQQLQQQEDAAQERRRRMQRQKQQNSPPHMAIMEAVVSSTMCHPNVVQVFTYMLSPLTSSSEAQADGSRPVENCHAPPGGGSSNGQDIAGWSLKLVMEFCEEGSLRDALDCGLLAKPGGFLAPSAVLTLAHDIAAAMLHLHSEGIVHGDLKAGNVMLTSCGASSSEGLSGARIWAATGGRPLTAKVADFGLAMPLRPEDTHATLLARGTPTHMSPELFISGHVSKASDVYAYGVLLYEVMTGRRAYAGIPIPLLPHEVAMQGLRPEWPSGMPPGCRDMRKLAEACWAHHPQDRPTFSDILHTLDVWSAGGHGWPPVLANSRTILPRQQQQQQEQTQQQPDPVKLQQQQLQTQGQQHQERQEQGQQAPAVVQAHHRHHQQQQQLQERRVVAQVQPSAQHGQQRGAEGEQQPQLALASTAMRRRSGEAQGRNMHMSWSEVDFNEG